MANEIWCKSCGERVSGDDTYCPNCHASLKMQDQSDLLPLDGIEIDKWYKFMGKKADYYVKTFTKNKDKKYYVDFNVWAWIFTSGWMMYRKMYLPAILTYLASIVFAFILGLAVLVADSMNSVLSMLVIAGLAYIFEFAVGLFGNSIYRQHVKKELSKPYPDSSKGGTSMGLAIVWAVGTSILNDIAVTPLLMFLYSLVGKII